MLLESIQLDEYKREVDNIETKYKQRAAAVRKTDQNKQISIIIISLLLLIIILFYFFSFKIQN
jgi:uncharacterized integral membrane protein